jgi:hypothetical protein
MRNNTVDLAGEQETAGHFQSVVMFHSSVEKETALVKTHQRM